MEMKARILRASGPEDDPDKLTREAEALFREGHERRRANPDEALKLCRKALDQLRDVYLLTKSPKAMKQLHRYGKRVHDLFQCPFEFKDGKYWLECPVGLSHLKYGVSPGMSCKEICSICELNMLECEHVKGWVYANVPARKIMGTCNICREKSCEHELGKLYSPVQAYAVMTDMRADHVAIVENPKDPLACITARTLDREEILEGMPFQLRAGFQYGMTLYCHHCRECNGGVEAETD